MQKEKRAKSLRQEAWVMFRDTGRWTDKFLKKGFGHCSIVFQADTRKFILIDPMSRRLQVINITLDQFNSLFKDPKRTIVKVKLPLANYESIFRLKMLTCVSSLEYILGLNFKCITPYGLFNKLTGKWKKEFRSKIIQQGG